MLRLRPSKSSSLQPSHRHGPATQYQTTSLVTNGEGADRLVWYNPNVQQMAETLKAIVMTQESSMPIPPRYNFCILHILESFHDLRFELIKKDQAIEQLQRHQNRLRQEMENCVNRWEMKEEQYREEIKRLEILLSRDERGLDLVALARTDSNLRGKFRNTETGISESACKIDRNNRNTRREKDILAVDFAERTDAHVSLMTKKQGPNSTSAELLHSNRNRKRITTSSSKLNCKYEHKQYRVYTQEHLKGEDGSPEEPSLGNDLGHSGNTRTNMQDMRDNKQEMIFKSNYTSVESVLATPTSLSSSNAKRFSFVAGDDRIQYHCLNDQQDTATDDILTKQTSKASPLRSKAVMQQEEAIVMKLGHGATGRTPTRQLQRSSSDLDIAIRTRYAQNNVVDGNGKLPLVDRQISDYETRRSLATMAAKRAVATQIENE